jgi:hypothetical protein
MKDYRGFVVAVFDQIRQAFPHLKMKLLLEDVNVDIAMEIPCQDGLSFDINLDLQSDELHMSVGGLWVTWFPCDDPQKIRQYLSSVRGLLSGEYRIVEHLQWNSVVKAELQRPAGTGWETVAVSARFHLPISWLSNKRILQNMSLPDPI